MVIKMNHSDNSSGIKAAFSHLSQSTVITAPKNYFLLLLFTDGSGHLRHGRNIYDFHPLDYVLLHSSGDVLVVPAYNHTCSLIRISFAQDHILYRTFQSHALTLIDSYLNSPADITFSSLSEKDFAIVKGMCDTCIQLTDDNYPYALFLKQQIISALIFYLARLYDISDIKKQRSRKSASHTIMIEQICQYVQQNYSASISLASISELMYVNPSYLSRIFKAETNVSLSAYINEVRIAAAKNMLLDTDELIIDIAVACGYNYIPHFNKIFRESTGMTPTQYRRANKKSQF